MSVGIVSVGIVIVSWNTRDAALRCVRSVLGGGGPIARVVVVDNASADGTADAVRAEFGESVEVIARAANGGYAVACNEGAARCGDASHLLFLNADVEVAPGCVETLVAALAADPSAVVAGPAFTHPDGRPQPSVRGHPTAAALLFQHTAARWLRIGRAAHVRYKRPLGDEVPRTTTVGPILLGACLLVRGDSFRAVRGFDEEYRLYFEEADLQRRLGTAGGRAIFVPSASAVHSGGASADQARAAALAWYVAGLLRYCDRFERTGFGFRVAFKTLFLLKLPVDALRDHVAWLILRRPGKREESLLFWRLLAGPLWRMLAA